MSKINYLLDKYESGKYVQGLYENKKQRRQRNQKTRIKQQLQILDDLLHEEPKLDLNQYEKTQVTYLIEKTDNFNQLYRKTSTETIILAFIFYVKLCTNSDIRLETWSICGKYELTNRKYMIIITRLFNLYLRKQPLPITETTSYDHSILEKQSL